MLARSLGINSASTPFDLCTTTAAVVRSSMRARFHSGISSFCKFSRETHCGVAMEDALVVASFVSAEEALAQGLRSPMWRGVDRFWPCRSSCLISSSMSLLILRALSNASVGSCLSALPWRSSARSGRCPSRGGCSAPRTSGRC